VCSSDLAYVQRLTELKPEITQDLLAERKGIYHYISHSTRADHHGKGRLDVSFVNIETGEVIQAFFNCGITYKIGPLKGKYYKTGRGGQFYVGEGSKLARFWLETFRVPANWSGIWRQMNHLKPLRFSCEIEEKQNQDETKTYRQIINLKRVQQ
jgi:hypothetical protein